jgi:hypothetical protein
MQELSDATPPRISTRRQTEGTPTMNEADTKITVRQELRRMQLVLNHLRHLDVAGLKWVRSVCDELIAAKH